MLYIVPTPIGNLRDITLRAIDVLKEADLIVCEDTRQTQKLLMHYDINGKGKTLSFHEHSGSSKLKHIRECLSQDQNVALVSDSGMPLVSDPGFEIVRDAIQDGFKVECLPGPNAAVTALAASGLAVDSFTFIGFLPQKSGARQKKIQSYETREETLIFYESPYRLVKALKDMREILGNREAVAARELTKKFEEISRGYLSDLIERFTAKPPLGEFVILVAGKNRKETLHA